MDGENLTALKSVKTQDHSFFFAIRAATFFVACICFSIGMNARALTLSGFVEKDTRTEKIYVKPTNSGTGVGASAGVVQLVPSQPYLRILLSRLNSGDFVVVTGQHVSEVKSLTPRNLMPTTCAFGWLGSSSSFRVDAIDNVGLKLLLGTWQSDRREIFEFRDFDTLVRYSLKMGFSTPLDQSELARLFSLRNLIWPTPFNHAREFSYVVAPDPDEDGYSILMSDQISVAAGILQVAKDELEIFFFDRKTGAIAEKYSLSPMTIR